MFMMNQSAVLALRLLSTAVLLCHGFVAEPWRQRMESSSTLLATRKTAESSRHDDESSACYCSYSTPLHQSQQLNRRQALSASLTIGSALTRVSTAQAVTTTVLQPEPQQAVNRNNHSNDESYYLDCLLDLPPHDPTTHIRLYLCRHGQTENNRLRRIQGARIDPSLNPTGQLQAMRLGQALQRLTPQPPETMFHSALLRAQETASTAAAAAARDAINKYSSPSQPQQPHIITPPTLETLPALAEVDFGASLEGEPVEQFRSRMVETYAKWAAGLVDQRMGSDGESAREIFSRMEKALVTLMAAASSSATGSAAAVTHSSYLKMLLAAVTNTSLFKIGTLEQMNCCINVMDISRDGAARWLRSGSGGGSLLLEGACSTPHSSRSGDGRVIPKVQRINEKRHLIGLL